MPAAFKMVPIIAEAKQKLGKQKAEIWKQDEGISQRRCGSSKVSDDRLNILFVRSRRLDRLMEQPITCWFSKHSL
jgi:hypothetical protein